MYIFIFVLSKDVVRFTQGLEQKFIKAENG